MNCCDEYSQCNRGIGCPAGACRRIKPYPVVPQDLTETKAPAWKSMGERMRRAAAAALLIIFAFYVSSAIVWCMP